MLRLARWLLRHHGDVMLLADRGFANHKLMEWLRTGGWHYCLRLPCDVLLHGLRRYPIAVGTMYPPLGEARFYKVERLWKLPPATHRRNVGLWQDGIHRCNARPGNRKGIKGILGSRHR